MTLAWVVALQAAVSSPPADVKASDFDLAKVKAAEESPWSRGCRPSDGSQIVVCGRRRGPDDYPYEEMERRYREKPVRAEAKIGKSTLRAYGESAGMPQGQVSKRAMVGIKVPF